MSTFLSIIVLIAIVLGVIAKVKAENAEQVARAAGAKRIVCPHCGHVGTVGTQKTKVKQGISGGKATGAILTGGISLLATGLSRKQAGQKMTCGNCRVAWFVA